MTDPIDSDSIEVVQLARHGGPEVLEVVGRPLPQPASHEVRVRAEAIGVGKPDALIGCAANLALQGGFKSADGEAVRLGASRVVFAGVRCTAG